jgi:hypothetical protein
LAHFHFLSWRIFISSVGAFSFPQLARFRFLSWRIFISSVGAFSFPQLARFRFLSWRIFVSSVGKNASRRHKKIGQTGILSTREKVMSLFFRIYILR